MAAPSLSREVELEPFRVEVHRRRSRVRVAPVGELDIATVGEIADRLWKLHDAGARRIVLDLRRLTFMDSTGLRLVLIWHGRARQGELDFALIPGPPAVQRVFEISGVLDGLPFRAV